LPLMDERRLQTLARSRSIRPQDGDAVGKQMVAFARKADESALGRLIVEGIILLSARNQPDAGKVLRNAALAYKVNTDAIALKVKQEFAAKDKAKKVVKPQAKKAA
jgi:ParB family chromosome partitioning protein